MNTLKRAKQLQRFIVRPALAELGDKYSGLHAERMVVGTALTESHGLSFDQITGPDDNTLGPAFGLWQIEPWVADDLYETFVKYNDNLADAVASLKAAAPSESIQLATNLCYAAAVCRLLYYRHPEPIPTTLDGMDEMWKHRYNTIFGKGKRGDFIKKAGIVMELTED